MEFVGQGQTSELLHAGLKYKPEQQVTDVKSTSKGKSAGKTPDTNSPPCKCDSGTHGGNKIEDLGQQLWLELSKKQLAQLDLQTIQGKCTDLKQYMAQQQQHTGFIPLSPLQLVGIKACTKCMIDKELCKDPVKLHQYVKQFQCLNFVGARVQVNHSINFELLEHLAKDYWDWQLPLFLKFGFPMDFKGEISNLKNATSSHASARQFPEHVTMYLEDELRHKAIYGPFEHKPFGDLTHISPFIT